MLLGLLNQNPSDTFSGQCVFIDYASGYMIIKNEVAIIATENVKEKLTFDREAKG